MEPFDANKVSQRARRSRLSFLTRAPWDRACVDLQAQTEPPAQIGFEES
jgi:hypothetical protein